MTAREDALVRFNDSEMSEKWRKQRAAFVLAKKARLDGNGRLYTHESSARVRRARDGVKLEEHDRPTVYLCRHGSTEFNRGGVGRDRVRGWLDVPLDRQGWRDAAVLAKVLADKSVVAIFASDLTRSVDTADEVAVGHPDAEYVKDSRLRSWNLGEMQGRKVSGDVIGLIKRYVREPHERPPGGESFDAFTKRFVDAANAILNCARDAAGAVVVVSHARNVQLFELWVRSGHSLRQMTDTYAENLASEPDTVRPGGYIELRHSGDGWEVTDQFREQTTRSTNAVS